MARGINKVILIGNLGADPEIKNLSNGSVVANISLATQEEWKDKTTGEKKSHTEWHKVVFFNRLAEIAGEYLKKGAKIYVEGSLKTRKWQDKDGADKYATDVIGGELQMLDSKNTPDQSDSTADNRYAKLKSGQLYNEITNENNQDIPF